MKSIYKVINEVPSHLITWGNPCDCNGRDVIVCITGNPGITDFYIEFGSEIHRETSLPVCVIGHAGHEEVPDQDSIKLHDHEHLFNLHGQVDHKLDFIKNHIDKKSRVHVIAHSIGAWITIELMDKNRFLQDKISSVNLLFPTIQKMAETNNGIFLNKFLVTCYLKLNALPPYYFERIEKVLNSKSLEKILFLAYNEMDTVLNLNIEGVKKLCVQTNIIYSIKDDWAPVQYIEDLKSIQPSFEMNQVDINHAFVMTSSERVALMVSEYILPRICKR